MKRQGIAVLLRIVVVTAALALSMVARPQAASAGWTWDEMTAVMTWTGEGSPADYGWTWDESAQPGDDASADSSSADDCATDDGWTWDESTDPGGDPGTDGWTWDEECATAPEPAPAEQPAPSEQPAP